MRDIASLVFVAEPLSHGFGPRQISPRKSFTDIQLGRPQPLQAKERWGDGNALHTKSSARASKLSVWLAWGSGRILVALVYLGAFLDYGPGLVRGPLLGWELEQVEIWAC